MLLAALLLHRCGAMDSDLYLYVTEGQPRCFIEELPGETLIIGSYKHPDAKTKPMLVRFTGPDGKTLTEELADENGRFAHHAEAAGEHRVCLVPDKSVSWPRKDKTAKVHLQVDVKGSSNDDEALDGVAKREHISSLEQELGALQRKVELIVKDLEYSRELEAHFRDQSERINGRVMWWSVFQSVALLLSGLWQINHLKNFFRAKKLV